MTTLNSVLLAGLSSLRASQTAIGVTSQNIANANTPGYVRAEATFTARSQMGAASGVDVTSITRAADRFLATASYLAQGANGAAQARSDLLARAQANFGNPTDTSSMFASLDSFWSALNEINVDPSSTLRRDDAVGALQSMFDEVQRVSGSVQSLIGEADQRIGDAVNEAQGLMTKIADLNKEIQLTKRTGADSTGAENAQSDLIDQLSKLLDINVTPLTEGGVNVRTNAGALLVGQQAAQISYTPNTAPFAQHGTISFNAQLGSNSNLESMISGGEIYGLLQARDGDLNDLAEALGGFSGALADALNQVHNSNTSTPPVSSMEGRQTGLVTTDSLNFTGQTTIDLVDGNGNLTQRIAIDFDAGTITTPSGTTNFNNVIGNSTTAGSFVEALNSALAGSTPAGSAEFKDGQLSMSVGGGGGIAIEDGTPPSDRAGRGFSHFFGLNDLVSRPTPIFFESGVSASDPHGITGGGINFEVRDASGRSITQKTVNVTGGLVGGTWQELLDALNDPATGVGNYGSYAMDATTGRVSFTPLPGYSVTITADSTERGNTGVSFSALNGLNAAATAGRAMEINVNSDIVDDPGRLAVAQTIPGVAVGERLVETGDNSGAQALFDLRDANRSFTAAGSMGAQTTTLALYASRLGGEAGRLANNASRTASGTEAVATAAADRRAQVEGVSVDDELVKMTAYQNAYAAAARVIQAATDMFDILMNIGTR